MKSSCPLSRAFVRYLALSMLVIALSTTLTGCSNGNASMTGTGKTGSLGSYSIVAVGDSLTAGSEDGTGITYPGQLASMTGQTVTNLGIGGQPSGSIAVRINAYEGQTQQTFPSSFTFPASGIASVSFQTGFEPCYNLEGGSDFYDFGVPIQFTVGGTTYTGRCKANVNAPGYSIRPETYPSAPVTVPAGTPWTAVVPAMSNGCVLIWAGRDNYLNGTKIQVDIAAMVAVVKQQTSCYLVMSIPNGAYVTEWKGTTDYNAIMTLNSELSATYSPGNHYLDIRTALVALYNPNNPADVLDYSHDVWPYSLRAGDIQGSFASPLASPSSCAFSTSALLTTGQVISANAELIQILGGNNGAYSCTRGYAGTMPGTYAGGTAFTGVDPLHLGQNPESGLNPTYTNGYTAVAAQVYAWLQSNAPK